MKSATITIRCPAKINLGLSVLGRRPDGYHEIRSILQSVSLHDTLEVQRARRFSLQIEEEWAAVSRGGGVPADGGNFVLKAAAGLKSYLGERAAAFRLIKRIPPGAGMGGASSDAAAAVVALDRLYDLGLKPPEFHRIAASIGSDVPFFLYGGACLALGRGEEIYPLPDGPSLQLVVVFSAKGLSTPEVYSRWDRLLTSTDKASRMNDFAPWCLVLRGEDPAIANDLETAAIALEASLGEVRSALTGAGAKAVSMTGSGSAFFGIFSDAKAAEHGASRLRRAGHAAVNAVSLGRAEWMEAVRAVG